MKRLVYSPKIQAWINGTEGVVDISPYIVSGSIQRRVNQVSSASLVLRNPVSQTGDYVGTLFTDFKRTDGTIGPLFHPMDPIIVTMQRLEGHPVQVFTGFLDKSPYLQLYPGLCQIEASCTLKRLLYTQFDAALPFVQYFLTLFGWVPNGDSGIMNPTAETDRLKIVSQQIQNQFNDGSLGGLLYAVMLYIGGWDASTVYIEALPTSIRDYVVALFDRLQANVNQDESIFQNLLLQILGSSNLGGGAPAGSGTLASGSGLTIAGQPLDSTQLANLNLSLGIASSLGANKHVMEAMVFAGIAENKWYDTTSPGNPTHQGVFQSTAFPAGQIAGATKAWLTGGPSFGAGGGIAYEKANPSASLFQIASSVEVSGSQYLAEAGYSSFAPDSVAIVNAYLAGGSNKKQKGSTTGLSANNVSTAPNAASTSTTGQTATQTGTSPGGKQGNTSLTSLSTYVNPFAKATGVVGERYDQGVDYRCTPGSKIVALGDCTFDGIDPNWYANQPLLAFKLTSGSLAGCRFYYAEGIGQPSYPLGTKFKAGDVVATTTSQPTGLEFGWASNAPGSTQTYAQSQGAASDVDSISLNASHMWGRLMAVLGAPQSSGGSPGSGQVAPNGSNGSGITSGAPGSGGGGGGGGTSATAAAFSTMVNVPSVFQSAEAIAFTGKRAFIADSPLFPFIEQLCQASLRTFMSMPNGNFFAFFPDYFGLFGRKYYWQVSDIEIMDGRIDLSDDPLTTHVAIAGDVTQYSGQVNVFDLLLTAGIFDIFDAFALGYVTGPDTLANKNLAATVVPDATNSKAKSTSSIKNTPGQSTTAKYDALAFLQKYGARTYVEEIPAIRSPFFELFYAFMKFMLLWSKQFQTTFELTFMPELFPGGLVAFPDHNLQLYVEEVTHQFDYTNGFTTIANFSSPAKLNDSSRANLREGMTRISPHQSPTVVNPALVQQASQAANAIDKQVVDVAKGIGKFG